MTSREEWNKSYKEMKASLDQREIREVFTEMRRRRDSPRRASCFLPSFIRRTVAVAIIFLFIWITQDVILRPLIWIAAIGGSLSFNLMWEFISRSNRPLWPGLGTIALLILLYLIHDILASAGYNLLGYMVIPIAFIAKIAVQIPSEILSNPFALLKFYNNPFVFASESA